MNTKKKRFAPKKRLIKHFLALTLAGSLLLPGLVLIRVENVEANPIVDMASGVIGKIRYNTTIAEIIVSLLSGSGATVTNQNWLDQINFSYGVNSTIATATGTDGTLGAMYEAGLFTIDDAGHFIDNGLADAIRQQSAYSTTGVSQLFETTATDMELGAWQTADAATNLGEAAAAGVSVGTLGQVFGAVTMGVHLGVLANKVCMWVGEKMAMQLPVNAPNALDNNIPAGYRSGVVYTRYYSGGWKNGVQAFYAPTDKTIFVKVKNGDNDYPFLFYSINVTNGSYNCIKLNSTDGGQNFNRFDSTISKKQYQLSNGYKWVSDTGFTLVNSTELAQLENETSVPYAYLPYSPDVIGPAGNQRSSNYSQPTNPESWPNLKPNQTLENENTGIKPIPWSDYIDQTTVFNDNTTNNETTINQGDTYNQFITQYITTPTELPDNNTVETPDYNPTVPEQPEPNPKEELTTEMIQDNTDYMTTPGLKDVFPFSIPWDIAGLFNVFSTDNREAPVITFPLKSELFGIDEEITIDLSPYDDVAALLRLLELIAFGLGLAFVTRYLIGAGG